MTFDWRHQGDLYAESGRYVGGYYQVQPELWIAEEHGGKRHEVTSRAAAIKVLESLGRTPTQTDGADKP